MRLSCGLINENNLYQHCCVIHSAIKLVERSKSVREIFLFAQQILVVVSTTSFYYYITIIANFIVSPLMFARFKLNERINFNAP